MNVAAPSRVSSTGSHDTSPRPEGSDRPERPDRPDSEAAQPAFRYRPGRGGYDPVAAALALQARCAFRRRVVLALLILMVITGLVAARLAMREAWWVHGLVDLTLVGYLIYRRRQVRIEQAIRSRRAARLAGGQRGCGRTVADVVGAPGEHPEQSQERPGSSEALANPDEQVVDTAGQPPKDAKDAKDDAPASLEAPALTPLRPVPLPEQPVGTELLELDDEDPELHELDHEHRWGYRRAAGQ